MNTPPKLSDDNFHELCEVLAKMQPKFCSILDTYGYPPLWSRPNTFESLVHIIIEQQVSLASAKATLEKLRERLGNITPELVLLLNDTEMKACYVSRQKASYIRGLARAILHNDLELSALEVLTDEDVRSKLLKLNGVGIWTIDIYLMMVLHRPDIFPAGDLAAVNALKQLKHLPKNTTREEVLSVAEAWRPYRTIATMLLWHQYLSTRLRTV